VSKSHNEKATKCTGGAQHGHRVSPPGATSLHATRYISNKGEVECDDPDHPAINNSTVGLVSWTLGGGNVQFYHRTMWGKWLERGIGSMHFPRGGLWTVKELSSAGSYCSWHKSVKWHAWLS